MTNEEALKFLSEDIKSQEKNYIDNLKYYGNGDNYTELYIEAIYVAIEALKNPEIIRCKDCEHYHYNYFSFTSGECDLTPNIMSDNDFCSLAEKKGVDKID